MEAITNYQNMLKVLVNQEQIPAYKSENPKVKELLSKMVSTAPQVLQ